MKKTKLTKEEKALETFMNEYIPVSRDEYHKVEAPISTRQKDTNMLVDKLAGTGLMY